MAMTWKALATKQKRLFDPYYDWVRATRFAYDGRVDWLPVLIELKEPRSRDFALSVFNMRGRDWSSLLRIPSVYRSPHERLRGKQTRFLTALAMPEFFERLDRGEEPSKDIKRFELSLAVAH